MNLTHKKICHEQKTVAPVENLIKSAFPPDEQVPMETLLEMSQRPMVSFWAYYDNNNFCGMIYVVDSKETLFILYLAVPQELRSNGYGAKIVEDVRKEFGGKNIVLHVEDPYEVEDEAKQTQRIRRIKFYERLGFKDTGYRIDGGDTPFFLISTEEEFRIQTYMDLMKEYSYGEYTPSVYKKEKTN